MSFDLNIKAEIKEVSKKLKQLQSRAVPRVVSRALNETATAHKNAALKQIAKDLRLPEKNLTGRFNSRGEKKGNRATIQKANVRKLTASITVYGRGIPLIQIISREQKRKAAILGRRLKGGIKAKGGRRYAHAFIAEAGSGNVQVFSRLSKRRYPLGIPKIGVYQRINKAYEKDINTNGRATFRKRFNRLIDYEIQKAAL